MSQSVADQPVKEPWVFLLGRPPIDEYLSFLIQASAGLNVDVQAAAERWRAAASVVDDLALREAGVADQRPASDIHAALSAHAAAYLADPAVGRTFAILPTRIGVISLDDLVVYQRHVNLRYAQQLQALLGEWSPEDPRLFDFCLAINQPQPTINQMQTGANTVTFHSVSTDARFLDATLIDQSQISGYVPQGRPVSALVLYVGYGVNALNVLNINGRLVLNNGSHRAYALRAAGLNEVPAVIQDVIRESDLSASPPIQQNVQLYLQHPRPRMLKDYFNDSLHELIEAPRRIRQIRLQFGFESSDVPG